VFRDTPETGLPLAGLERPTSNRGKSRRKVRGRKGGERRARRGRGGKQRYGKPQRSGGNEFLAMPMA